MFEVKASTAADKAGAYRDLLQQARALMADERDRIANAANFASLLFHALPDLNWCGFYFFDGHELVVGPFQGKPACVRIALGKGVCGTAAATGETQVVANVHEFPGHIACDSASESEIVVPMFDAHGSLLGVFDIDSPILNRFDADDRRGIEALVEAYVTANDPSRFEAAA